MSRTFDFGTDPHKLHRTDATWTSIQAAYGVNSTKWERRVYNAIADLGEASLDAVWTYIVRRYYANRPAHDPIFSSLANTISGRFSALREKGLIRATGRTNTGVSGKQQVIYELVPAAPQQEMVLR